MQNSSVFPPRSPDARQHGGRTDQFLHALHRDDKLRHAVEVLAQELDRVGHHPVGSIEGRSAVDELILQMDEINALHGIGGGT